MFIDNFYVLQQKWLLQLHLNQSDSKLENFRNNYFVKFMEKSQHL